MQQILVIGAGLGGLACALACARSGARVDVLESRASFKPLPIHVNVVPHMLRDFARLGVADECVRAGFAYHGVAVVDEFGNGQFELPTPRLAGGKYPCAVGITFERLHGLLLNAAREAGAAVHMDMAVESLDAERGCALLADGTVARADVVVLATGSGSALVEQLCGRVEEDDVARSSWHMLIRRPKGIDRATWMLGERGRRLLLLPVGMNEAGLVVVDSPRCPSAEDEVSVSGLLENWGEWPRRIASLLPSASPTALRFRTATLPRPPWARGAVLAAGASVHAIASPFGQSMAQAMEDAAVLADLLADPSDKSALLARYVNRRLPRSTRLQALSCQAARWIDQPEPATDLVALAHEIDSLTALPA